MIQLRYLGRCPKVVQLPIPFLAHSMKTGEVTCNPVGQFPDADAEALLAMGGLFERVVGAAPAPPVAANAPAGVAVRREAPQPKRFKSKGLAIAWRNKNCPDDGVLHQLDDGTYEVRIIGRPSPAPAEGAAPSPRPEGLPVTTTDHLAGDGEGHEE